jgi:hypothetical protein
MGGADRARTRARSSNQCFFAVGLFQSEAHRLSVEIGATARAEQVAREIGR